MDTQLGWRPESMLFMLCCQSLPGSALLRLPQANLCCIPPPPPGAPNANHIVPCLSSAPLSTFPATVAVIPSWPSLTTFHALNLSLVSTTCGPKTLPIRCISASGGVRYSKGCFFKTMFLLRLLMPKAQHVRPPRQAGGEIWGQKGLLVPPEADLRHCYLSRSIISY